jgi:hypothetical protein
MHESPVHDSQVTPGFFNRLQGKYGRQSMFDVVHIDLSPRKPEPKGATASERAVFERLMRLLEVAGCEVWLDSDYDASDDFYGIFYRPIAPGSPPRVYLHPKLQDDPALLNRILAHEACHLCQHRLGTLERYEEDPEHFERQARRYQGRLLKLVEAGL